MTGTRRDEYNVLRVPALACAIQRFLLCFRVRLCCFKWPLEAVSDHLGVLGDDAKLALGLERVEH